MIPYRWTAIEGGFFAIVTVWFATFAIRMDARPTAVFFGAAALLLVYFGVELRAIELPRGVTIRFREDSGADERTGDDEREA